jgi:hypothetical protein
MKKVLLFCTVFTAVLLLGCGKQTTSLAYNQNLIDTYKLDDSKIAELQLYNKREIVLEFDEITNYNLVTIDNKTGVMQIDVPLDITVPMQTKLVVDLSILGEQYLEVRASNDETCAFILGIDEKGDFTFVNADKLTPTCGAIYVIKKNSLFEIKKEELQGSVTFKGVKKKDK